MQGILWRRCQYIDLITPNKGVLKQGLLREDVSPYQDLTKELKQANAEAMETFIKTGAR